MREPVRDKEKRLRAVAFYYGFVKQVEIIEEAVYMLSKEFKVCGTF